MTKPAPKIIHIKGRFFLTRDERGKLTLKPEIDHWCRTNLRKRWFFELVKVEGYNSKRPVIRFTDDVDYVVFKMNFADKLNTD